MSVTQMRSNNRNGLFFLKPICYPKTGADRNYPFSRIRKTLISAAVSLVLPSVVPLSRTAKAISGRICLVLLSVVPFSRNKKEVGMKQFPGFCHLFPDRGKGVPLHRVTWVCCLRYPFHFERETGVLVPLQLFNGFCCLWYPFPGTGKQGVFATVCLVLLP